MNCNYPCETDGPPREITLTERLAVTSDGLRDVLSIISELRDKLRGSEPQVLCAEKQGVQTQQRAIGIYERAEINHKLVETIRIDLANMLQSL